MTTANWTKAERAHPRSRGENLAVTRSSLATLGSSPLTRGKLTCRSVLGQPGGLIPAHAGKTPSIWVAGLPSWAHPRSRGENELSVRRCASGEGSSPLTRGKPPTKLSFVLMRGLIPAHAGKTPTSPAAASQDGAHPRSRGENSEVCCPRATTRGSSPLTRGKRLRHL